MPWFGLGVYKVEEGDEVYQSVKSALSQGYKSIDTAAVYGNEEGVGREIVPMVNQVEYHLRLAQKELLAFCKESCIQMEAWSPLMQGELLNHPVLAEIAENHGKSVAQVILRWDLQNVVVTIPKSVKAHRIRENSEVFDFEPP